MKEIHHYESVDANGLMLTSQKSTDTNPSTFVWRGNDLVQETAPDGTVSHYNVVNGVLVSFERAGVTYTVQSDARMGHVRSVTDSNGTVVYTARYDAWGNLLTSTDNVPGGMPYRYVGALGVRWDATTGLYYMRHRWYDPGLQQFMSKDPLKSNADPYEYANDTPAMSADPSGLYAVLTFHRRIGLLEIQDYRQVKQHWWSRGEWVPYGAKFSCLAFSGDTDLENSNKDWVKKRGPVPLGEYLLFHDNVKDIHPELYDADWYLLVTDPAHLTCHVQVVNPKTKEIVDRSDMYLHTGLASLGCITVPSEEPRRNNGIVNKHYPYSSRYNIIKEILRRTQPLEVARPVDYGVSIINKFPGVLYVVEGW